MKCLFPIPERCLGHLKKGPETGIGYHVVSVTLQDGQTFDQVVVSEGCIIEVRGHQGIPFSPDDVTDVNVTHKRWNFRDNSDSRTKVKVRAAGA
jgi:hypothetical protein